MTAYGQYCPVARALEVVGDRWTLLIVRELLFGNHHFNEIERGLPGISRSLLSQRLQWLERGGVVERRLGANGRTREYLLTSAGRELRPLMEKFRDWGARWAFDDPRPDELDPAWLLSSMLYYCRAQSLPKRRVVIEFRFRKSLRSHLWMLLEARGGGDVCLKHPGFDPDLVISAEASAFFKLWMGRLPRLQAERSGLLRIEGPPELRRAFHDWFNWPSLPRPAAAEARSRAAPGDGPTRVDFIPEPRRP